MKENQRNSRLLPNHSKFHFNFKSFQLIVENPKAITLANHNRHRQCSEPIITCRYEAREKVLGRVMIGLCREVFSFKKVTKRDTKPMQIRITFDFQMKIALYETLENILTCFVYQWGMNEYVAISNTLLNISTDHHHRQCGRRPFISVLTY